jgi:hypothetical protein
VKALSKAELSAMVEEATIDAHDEEEQLMGFFDVLQEELTLPFETMVLGVKVTVADIDQTATGVGRELRPRQPPAGDPPL